MTKQGIPLCRLSINCQQRDTVYHRNYFQMCTNLLEPPFRRLLGKHTAFSNGDVFQLIRGDVNRCTSQREGIFSISDAPLRPKSARRCRGEDKIGGKDTLTTRKQCASWFVAASFTLVEMHRKCKTRSYSSRNWKEHCCFLQKEKMFEMISRFFHSHGLEGFSEQLVKIEETAKI